MSFYFFVYFKSVGARPYIRKNGIKVNSILENAKSPVLATVSKSERQEQKSAIPIKKVKVFWEVECFFCKIGKSIFK
jgi:hypothetical protein